MEGMKEVEKINTEDLIHEVEKHPEIEEFFIIST